ncbi:MAG: LOG family protein [Patescibacteria group bacterium]
MANLNPTDIYIKKKRRSVGEMIKPAEIRNTNAWLSIHGSSKEFLLTYESEGLVVSINGSGALKLDHTQCQEAARLAEYIMKQGGIVMSGGRKSGIMEAVSQVAKEKSMGVIFPELEKEQTKHGKIVITNAPTPRIEILATAAPIIVVFRGGIGSLMMLMRAITHHNNRKFHPKQPPQKVFVSNYWVGLLTSMINMGALPKEFVQDLQIFASADDIIKKIPPVK